MLGSSRMAEVKPFRAERYDEAEAGPLQELVAPPYDVISSEERAEYLSRSPYNVVHLTLPDDEEQAGRDLADWRREGVIVRDAEPSFRFLSQDYVGPDGVSRTRSGLVASLRAEPYEDGAVLPHERTHRGPKEGRLRLLRATRTQLEPIFLLYEGEPLQPPAGTPDLQSRGDAEAAFLLRPTRIEDVWAVARRGETMPQKSTYFYPKLTSGLLFHPLD